MIEPHCKPGRYLILKGPRNITTRLPRKFLETTAALRAAAERMRGMGGGR